MTLKILRRDALARMLTHPGELGLARAFVAGDIDVEGDLDALFGLEVPPMRGSCDRPRCAPSSPRSARRAASTVPAVDRGAAARRAAQPRA